MALTKEERDKAKRIRDRAIEDIASAVFGFPLHERGLDSLDFHEVSCGQVNEALERAYLAGIAHAHAQVTK